jgi:hypothetical protein
MFMSWLGDSGTVVRPHPWVFLLLPARLTCPSIHLHQKLMNGISKPMEFHSCQLKMKKVKMKNFLMTGSSMSRLHTRGIRVHLHPILFPRILLAAILPDEDMDVFPSEIPPGLPPELPRDFRVSSTFNISDLKPYMGDVGTCSPIARRPTKVNSDDNRVTCSGAIALLI